MNLTDWETTFREKIKKDSIAYLRVKIIPSSAKSELVEILDDGEKTLKIRIAAPPEKGKANKEICKFLGKYFQCQCDIISGGTTSVKLIRLFR
ncbi:DUF167 domain-containing protein [Candidatus Gracilibacteria bacterium]|nr:DUF167 domain-containing protein [Candidatus Gracilibacteria bacterium]